MKIWCDDYNDDTYTDAAIETPKRFIGVPMASGQPLTGKFPEYPRIVIRSSTQPTDYFMAGPMLVTSDRLRRIIESFSTKIELFPIQLVQKKDQTVGMDYYFMNILELVDCLDWDLARFVPEGGFATNIEKLVVRNAAAGQGVFRIAKTIPSIVGVSDELAVAVQSAKCTGMEFKEPSVWTNPMKPVPA